MNHFGEKIKEHFSRLSSSIDIILVRNKLDNEYEVYAGDLSDSNKYVDAINRIKGMNNKNRSGDIVLIMKDYVDIPQGESIKDYRYTTGVSCKSWHGSLNRSDSYVPLIVTYPGGNKYELEPLIEDTEGCSISQGCDGNWRVTDLIKTIIETQYKEEQ